MCSSCPALPPLQQATRPLSPRSSKGITSASTFETAQCQVRWLHPRRVASWLALYVVLTLTLASLRPPPIPQPQMYHGVSPAATSGGNNGNMVSLQSSFFFRLLPWPSCLPISIYRMAPALLRLQYQKLPSQQRANWSRHIPTFTILISYHPNHVPYRKKFLR